MEISEKERLSREDVAARLHALSDALARHNEVEFEPVVCASRCMCPTKSTSTSRIEIGQDDRELEVELTW